MNWYKKFPMWATLALLIYMPFHLFLTQWLSSITGGTDGIKAAKDVALALLVPICFWAAYKAGLLRQRTYQLLVLAALSYSLLHLLFILFDRNLDLKTALTATAYNTRLIWYLVLALTAVQVWPEKPFSMRTILTIVLAVSTLVSLFGIAQYFLPKDLMTHFGYSIARGARPAFFIDDKPNLPRIMSTIRDPNSLGAYLILPIVILFSLLFKKAKNANLRSILLGLLGIHGLALLLTFSRGAWLGTVLALGVVAYLQLGRGLQKRFTRHQAIVVVAIVILALCGLFALRNTYTVKNVVVHADESTMQADPNELRVELGRQAAQGIVNKPLGHGPGTAGIVSIRNPKSSQLTENYYLQIGYEIGIIGLLFFLAILAYIYWLLLQTSASTERTALLASFWAYAFIALLIHLWSNEAVAAQWWLLAGLAIGQTFLPVKRQKKARS